MKRQAGFTLVEIAIVLVIIGLLLGSVLKGQEFIRSARVKAIANDLRSVPTYVYGYQDRYRAIPGDDPAAVPHLGATAAQASGAGTNPGDGRVDGAWNAAAGESFLFWQHIRLANLTSGVTDVTDTSYPPLNAAGGRLGISSASPVTGMTNGAYFACAGGVSGQYVVQLDTQLDDGNTAVGAVQATTQTTPGAAVATASVVANTDYIVCLAF